ncbi:hypothetical protein N7499_006314 [Penicillium canescens]|nr:hypothetical protein N7499_006314 [Penicillium canescens]
MDPDEACVFNSQGSMLGMAGHDTPLSRAQPWLGRCPHTLGSNEASVFSGAPGQPVMESHAPHPLKDKVAIPRGQSADLRSRIREYEELLRTLHPRLDRQMATEVEKVIGGVGDQDRSFPLGGSGGTQLPATSPMTPRPSPVKEGQQATNNPVQPTDHTTEDLNRDGDTRATGLVGPRKTLLLNLWEAIFKTCTLRFPSLGNQFFWNNFAVIMRILARNLLSREKGIRSRYVLLHTSLEALRGGFAVLDRPSLQQVQIESLISLYLLSLGHINRAWRMCSIAMRSAVAIGVHLRTENAAISSISKETRYRLWWALYSLDVQLCLMTGRPLNMDLRYCTTPLPVPYHEEDFLDGRVAQIIANEDIRKALVSFLIPRAAKPDSGDQQRFARSLPSAVMEGGENDPDASSVPESIKPNTSLYFLCRVGLACIGRTAMDEIHSSSTALLSWDEVENSITRNNASADGWLAQLPSYYNFDKSSPNCPFNLACAA